MKDKNSDDIPDQATKDLVHNITMYIKVFSHTMELLNYINTDPLPKSISDIHTMMVELANYLQGRNQARMI
jgi:hypothetical protein